MNPHQHTGDDALSGACHGAGWFIVTAAALMLALIMGMLVNGLTAFFLPMAAAEGWAGGELAAINSLTLGMTASPGPS